MRADVAPATCSSPLVQQFLLQLPFLWLLLGTGHGRHIPLFPHCRASYPHSAHCPTHAHPPPFPFHCLHPTGPVPLCPAFPYLQPTTPFHHTTLPCSGTFTAPWDTAHTTPPGYHRSTTATRRLPITLPHPTPHTPHMPTFPACCRAYFPARLPHRFVPPSTWLPYGC